MQAGYDVVTTVDFVEALQHYLNECFDLILVGADQAEGNLRALEELVRTSGDRRRFVVMFPIRPTPHKMRIVFKAGAYDCVDKPYEPEALLQMVATQITDARQHNAQFANDSRVLH